MGAVGPRTAIRALTVLLVTALWIALAACAPVRFVPDYDAESSKTIVDISADTLAFYDQMITAGADQMARMPRPADCHRVVIPYDPYKEGWSRIETKLRVMVVREESRPLNSESARIARKILSDWEKKREMHLTSNNYRLNADDCATAVLKDDRRTFQRYFVGALSAEEGKKLADASTEASAK